MQSHARVLSTNHQCCESLVRSAKIVIFVEKKFSYMHHRLASKNLWCFIGSLQAAVVDFTLHWSCKSIHVLMHLNSRSLIHNISLIINIY